MNARVGPLLQQLIRRCACRSMSTSPAPPLASCLPPALEIPAATERPLLERPPAPAPSQGLFQLMAVPKRKVSKSRKGIRNGPKALKPQPVIIRCKSCGRVKLPHFFCCSGEKKFGL